MKVMLISFEVAWDFKVCQIEHEREILFYKFWAH